MKKIFKILFALVILLFMMVLMPKSSKAATYKNSSSTIEVILNGTDANYKTNTLTVSNISVYVGGTLITPATKTLSTAQSITNGVQYVLTLTGVTGNGALTVKVTANTIEDQATNKNIETTLNTGIIVDNIAPTFAYNTFTYNTIPSQGLPITVKGTATDAESGIDYICVNEEKKSYNGASSGTISGSVNDSYSWNTFYAVDKAGNRSLTYTYVLQINYTLNPNNTTRVMDVAGAGFTNLTNIQLYDSNSGDSQKFRIIKDKTGTFKIVNKISSKVVDIYANQTANGTNISVYDSNGGTGQSWVWIPSSTSEYGWLLSKNTFTKAIDVSGGGTTNGTNIQIWDKSDVSQQKWKMTPSVNAARVYTSDTTAPSITLASNSSGGNWTNQNVSVRINGSDSESGIDHYEWYDGSWKTTDVANSTDGSYAQILFTNERNSTISFRAVDKAGNYSNEVSTVVRIDKTPPSVTNLQKIAGGWVGGTQYGNWCLFFTYGDNLSGISYRDMEWETSSSNPCYPGERGTPATMDAVGTWGDMIYVHWITLKDYAGNSATYGPYGPHYAP